MASDSISRCASSQSPLSRACARETTRLPSSSRGSTTMTATLSPTRGPSPPGGTGPDRPGDDAVPLEPQVDNRALRVDREDHPAEKIPPPGHGDRDSACASKASKLSGGSAIRPPPETKRLISTVTSRSGLAQRIDAISSVANLLPRRPPLPSQRGLHATAEGLYAPLLNCQFSLIAGILSRLSLPGVSSSTLSIPRLTSQGKMM